MLHLKPGSAWAFLLVCAMAGARVPEGLDLKLMKAVTSDLGKNQVISPFVMSSLMTQVWLGARGATRDEMTPVLGLCGPADHTFLPAYKAAIDDLSAEQSDVITAVFNKIYCRATFTIKPSFTDFLVTYYGASVRKFSSEAKAAAEINADVANVTRGLIQDLVTKEALDGAQMVLVSALYFKGQWKYRFNRTETEPFLTSSGDKQVSMMKLETRLEYAEMGIFDVLALPYKNEDYRMLLLRPISRAMQAVKNLRDSLDLLDVGDIVQQLAWHPVNVSMPRFSMKTKYELKATMPKTGIRKIFSSSADFSGISDKPLAVSEIIHKVFINVTEEGTEAAGAGAVIIVVTSAPPPDVEFKLDRPFFAILYDKKHRINLFSAYVASP